MITATSVLVALAVLVVAIAGGRRGGSEQAE